MPMFYERRDNTAGNEWMRRVKQSLMYLSPQFDSRRMVTEYMTQLYEPAHTAFTAMRARNFENAREKALWSTRVIQAWDHVRIVETSPAPVGAVTSGKPIQVRAAVDLAGLGSKDIRVEAVVGRVGPSGALEDTEVIVLPATNERLRTDVTGTGALLRLTLPSIETKLAMLSVRSEPKNWVNGVPPLATSPALN